MINLQFLIITLEKSSLFILKRTADLDVASFFRGVPVEHGHVAIYNKMMNSLLRCYKFII